MKALKSTKKPLAPTRAGEPCIWLQSLWQDTLCGEHVACSSGVISTSALVCGARKLILKMNNIKVNVGLPSSSKGKYIS